MLVSPPYSSQPQGNPHISVASSSFTRLVSGTDDLDQGYGPNNVRALNKSLAINNADSYSWYANVSFRRHSLTLVQLILGVSLCEAERSSTGSLLDCAVQQRVRGS